VERVLFHDNFAHRYGGGLWCEDIGLNVTRCTFVGNTAGWSGGAIGSTQATNVLFEQCILYENAATSGGALYHGNIHYVPDFLCCTLFDNTEPITWGIAVNPVGQDGNFASDPLFCDPASGDFSLAGNSPCLPAGNDCGLLIGAYGEGCPPRDRAETGLGAGEAPRSTKMGGSR